MTAANWRERYTASVLRSCFERMKENEEAPVKTRQLTQEEMHLIFDVDANNIKDIKL